MYWQGMQDPPQSWCRLCISFTYLSYGYTMYCLWHCCYQSISKSIEFVNFMNCFRCLLIKSCLFVGQVPCFDVSLFGVSLGCCSRMQQYIRWSVVCSSLPQGHVGLSSSLNWCRQALVLPCPVTRAVKLGVTCILRYCIQCYSRIHKQYIVDYMCCKCAKQQLCTNNSGMCGAQFFV